MKPNMTGTSLYLWYSNLTACSKMADIEKLVAFNGIRAYLTSEDQTYLLQKLNLDNANLPHRLRGLNVETEFFLILTALGSCKHLLSFDEGTSVLTDSYSPDALLVLKGSEEKIFVEIKSKDEFLYKISGGNLQKRIDFAAEFGHKLYFAIRLDGYWVLYPSEYIQNKAGKLTIDDFKESDFESVFQSKLFIFPAGIKVISQYSFNHEPLIGIRHGDYGNLFSYKFYFNDKLIFESDNSSPESQRRAITGIILEALHDVMSNQSQQVDNIGDGITQIVECLTETTFFNDYTIILSHIFHTADAFGGKHDATTFYKAILESREKATLNRGLLDNVVSMLISNGVPIMISSNGKGRA